jgi:anti-sigma-K factor RskA
MNTELDHPRVLELLPLYVTGALEPEELLAVDAYLQRHHELLDQLAALEAVMVRVAQSTPTAPLPNDGRARLLTRVQQSLSAPVTPAPASSSPQAVSRPASQWDNLRSRFWRRAGSGPLSPAPPDSGQEPPRLGWLPRLGWAVAATALVLALVLSGVTLFQQNQLGALRTTVARLMTENDELRQVNQQLQQELQQGQSQLALLLNAERSIVLAGTELAPQASGAFYLRAGEGIVVVNGLAPLPEDQTYQLWLVPPGGTPTSVALLPGQGDEVVSTVAVPPELRNFTIVDVSIEPTGGSAAITKEAIVLRGVLN